MDGFQTPERRPSNEVPRAPKRKRTSDHEQNTRRRLVMIPLMVEPSSPTSVSFIQDTPVFERLITPRELSFF